MQEGLVSASFEAVRVPEALEAVRRASGVEIVVPVSVQDKKLTLAVERAGFEQFVRPSSKRWTWAGSPSFTNRGAPRSA